MPTCTREGLDKKTTISVEDFKDDEKVFFCETTGEIFRDYEQYFQRVMLINSTIWACELTGRDNLTYAEALKSEREARRKLCSLKDIIKAPALMIAEVSYQTSFRNLVQLIYQYLKDRYFVGEEVTSANKSKNYVKCKIVNIIKPNKAPDDEVYDPKTIKYKVESIKNPSLTWIAPTDYVRRARMSFIHDNLRAFLKETVTQDEELLYRPTKEAYKKYITDKNIKYDEIFIGKLPEWKRDEKKLARIKAQKVNKTQSSISNYLVKNNGENGNGFTKNKEMKKMEERQAELERRKAEILLKIEEDITKLATKSDDLERIDQKVLPLYKPVKALVPTKYFGDFLMIQEFINSFVPILSLKDVFKKTITMQQMNRAFLTREVAGPLSDIFLVLLSTIFSLQLEEDDECDTKYVKSIKTGFMWDSANKAVATHDFIKKHFADTIYNLPLDAQTLSELLRLHLLGSGAPTSEKSEKWRFQYRNGYSVTEDPGLMLRIQYPHIIRALKTYTIYQLPFKDIVKILNCLIEQILTYYGCINLLEETLDNYTKARGKIKMYIIAKNKQIADLAKLKRKIFTEFQLESQGQPDKKIELERAMNRKISKLDLDAERELRNWDYKINLLRDEIFDYMSYLGSDRAYRKYYIFQSLHGVFVEHPSESLDHCLEDPPKNIEALAKCPRTKKDIRQAVTKLYKEVDKENVGKLVVKKPEIQTTIENGEIVKTNGISSPVTTAENGVDKPPPTQYELYMCTGNPQACIVHDPKNPDRVRWSYIHTKEDLTNLIDSLNPLGTRESALRTQLEELQEKIISHLKDCPTDLLTIPDDATMETHRAQMIAATQRSYANSNFGASIEADINDVMYDTLLDQIINLESNITNGYLAKLQVSDIDKWREDLIKFKYDSQCERLSYGFDGEEDNGTFVDPGEDLGDTLDIESEDSADELLPVHDSPTLRQHVRNLASALLQIEQAIDQKFLKEPFGVKNENAKDIEAKLKAGKIQRKLWEISLMNSTSYSQIFLHYNLLSDAIKWNKSSTQSKCLICKRKGDAEQLLLCDECNAGTHMFCLKPPLKEVPAGNWYCKVCEKKLGIKKEKPKYNRKKVFTYNGEEDEKEFKGNGGIENSESDDDEYKPYKKETRNRKQNKTKKNNITNMTQKTRKTVDSADEYSDEEIEDEVSIDGAEEEEDVTMFADNKDSCSSCTSDEDESLAEISRQQNKEKKENCKVCTFHNCDLSCDMCKMFYHLECIPLRRLPRGAWTCTDCKNKREKKKRKVSDVDSDSSDEGDIPLAKRQRNSLKTLRNNTTSSNGIDDINRNNNNSRRGRRTADDLPLNSVILYDLLNEIMKHEDAWPFLRPVSQTEVPDYYKIIKNPMDFARIKSKLNMARYTFNEEVMKDIELVFKNCDTYNTEGNEIYLAGASLEKFVVKECKKLNLPFTPSDMISSTID